MAASIALHLRSRPRSFLRPFSSSSIPPPPPNDVNPQNSETNPKTSFSDLKSHLRDPQQQQQRRRRQQQAFSQPSPPNHKPSPMSLDDVRNNLRDFRRRSTSPSSPQQPISFQELYKKSVSDPDNNPSPTSPLGSMASIKEQLLRKKSHDGTDSVNPISTSPWSLSRLKESLRLRPGVQDVNSSRVLGGTTEGLPLSVFGKELRAKTRRFGETGEVEDTVTGLARDYTYEELGKRLKELRPEKNKQGFSVSELSERLVKLREIESKEEVKGVGMYSELRRTIVQISDAQKNQGLQRGDLLSHLNGTPNYMLTPPKEHLVEKYFHPDNMSSAEKMKLELKRVRDEFKMSETDCGSTRVQIAQLTTEISHLSKVLHKKDKHSRKGLIAKVQLRKKLLKYLRRTDWDSYCFILSKLGLRDNPGYKQLPSKTT